MPALSNSLKWANCLLDSTETALSCSCWVQIDFCIVKAMVTALFSTQIGHNWTLHSLWNHSLSRLPPPTGSSLVWLLILRLSVWGAAGFSSVAATLIYHFLSRPPHSLICKLPTFHYNTYISNRESEPADEIFNKCLENLWAGAEKLNTEKNNLVENNLLTGCSGGKEDLPLEFRTGSK